jgi:hypothetical protein
MTTVRPADELTLVNDQIRASQNSIAYDSKEYVVEVIVSRFEKKLFFIPDYQRAFVWQKNRKCKFIESVLMGLPIPFMFGVQNEDGRIEILDGAQRIQTLHEFVNNNLALNDLERLDLLDDYLFSELPMAQQNKFLDRSMRMVVLPETINRQVKLDMFERINTGSEDLKKSEIRKGAYSGVFFDLVVECAKKPLFISLCPISEARAIRGEAEELVLRFFAYSEKYSSFKHSVSGFLNDYLKEKNSIDFDKELYMGQFVNTLEYVSRNFPMGFAKTVNAKSTPRVRFESIAVGVNLALLENADLQDQDTSFTEQAGFAAQTTTHASNSGPRLKARVEFVKNQLLEV